MQLTKNFSLQEMIKSETALRQGMDNTPPQYAIDNLHLLCVNILQPIRDHFNVGVKVNSGFRSPQVNAAVGGSKTSDHCYGRAADIEIPGMANHALATYIAHTFMFTQLILEFYTPGVPDSGWVHVSYNPDDLKRQVMSALQIGGKTVYQPGLVA